MADRTQPKKGSHRGLVDQVPGLPGVIWKADLEANLNVCPKCQHHFKIGARQRIDLLLEPGYELVDGGCARPTRWGLPT
jgi:acetyl-CoA carboxylase beta subunit